MRRPPPLSKLTRSKWRKGVARKRGERRITKRKRMAAFDAQFEGWKIIVYAMLGGGEH
jgi:hypothetical protein